MSWITWKIEGLNDKTAPGGGSLGADVRSRRADVRFRSRTASSAAGPCRTQPISFFFKCERKFDHIRFQLRETQNCGNGIARHKKKQ